MSVWAPVLYGSLIALGFYIPLLCRSYLDRALKEHRMAYCSLYSVMLVSL